MPTINAGVSTAVTVAVGTYLNGTGAGQAVIGAAGVVDPLTAGDAWQIGPFDRATVVSITAFGAIEYEVVNPAADAAALQSLVSGAGNPTDLLAGPVQRVTITGAMSTTATQAAAATGTYYKARVVWNNNGASGTAKLRIAVNADNDVHGLMIGQNVKRRDYEMTMGDGVMLVCGVPITRLTFSADGSITGGTHQLQVAFGN